MLYSDRAEAGFMLSTRLGHLASADPMVLGLSARGMPVAAEIARALNVSARTFDQIRDAENPSMLSGRTVVLVDDGATSGARARAACRITRSRGAARVILVLPVAPRPTVRSLRNEADEMVCPGELDLFTMVDAYYLSRT